MYVIKQSANVGKKQFTLKGDAVNWCLTNDINHQMHHSLILYTLSYLL